MRGKTAYGLETDRRQPCDGEEFIWKGYFPRPLRVSNHA